LRKAGGPTKDADRGHEFLIRADGEVVSRDAEKTAWGDAFNNLRMYPGDTLVVPEKTFKPSALRGVLDWSQLLSQLAISAAVINVLR
jgi:protein involved in polysaccharide export with SLBB domain